MEDFVRSFMYVDANGNGKVTLDEIRIYAQKNKLDSSMVQKWQQLFDLDHNGTITLENFLKVLGIKMEDYVELKKRNQQAASNQFKLGSDVQVIQAGIPLEDQVKISDEIRRIIMDDEEDKSHQMTIAIKAFLDLNYGRTWHVVVVNGPMRLAFTHLVDQVFFFILMDHTIAIWQTPDF